jgi:hypothetical protein
MYSTILILIAIILSISCTYSYFDNIKCSSTNNKKPWIKPSINKQKRNQHLTLSDFQKTTLKPNNGKHRHSGKSTLASGRLQYPSKAEKQQQTQQRITNNIPTNKLRYCANKQSNKHKLHMLILLLQYSRRF